MLSLNYFVLSYFHINHVLDFGPEAVYALPKSWFIPGAYTYTHNYSLTFILNQIDQFTYIYVGRRTVGNLERTDSNTRACAPLCHFK